MNLSQALNKLRKLLGPKAGIRDSKRPSSPAQRAKDHIARQAANAAKAAAQQMMEARQKAVLAADQEYQERRTEYLAALEVQKLSPSGHYYRYTAGRLGALFFSVDAEADTLDELVAKVAAVKAPKEVA